MNEEYCFVIMSLDPSMEEVYEDSIKLAVEKIGLKCLRMDKLDGTSNIARRMVEGIHGAKVVIADLSGAVPEVFYQLGVAHALGNNTIFIAQNPEKELPFDIRNYKVIKYEKTMRGGRLLSEEIVRAIQTLEQWSNPKSPTNPVQEFLPAEVKTKISLATYQALEEQKGILENRLQQAQQALADNTTEHEGRKQELENIRAQNEELRYQNKELETLRNLIERLFQDLMPKGGKTNTVDTLKKVISDVENQGEVKLEVQSGDKGKNNPATGKVIFKKVN